MPHAIGSDAPPPPMSQIVKCLDATLLPTLVPIAPRRLKEKEAAGDFFFRTILTEGVPLATED